MATNFASWKTDGVNVVETEQALFQALRGSRCLVLVYASWCRHCHDFAPEFGQLAKAARESGAKLDFEFSAIAFDGSTKAFAGDGRGSAKELLRWDSFPTVYFTRPAERGGRISVTEYKGGMRAQEILDVFAHAPREHGRA